MEYRTLGRTDLKVSSIGLGGATFGREIDKTSSFALLDRALEHGINFFDTAAGYADGASEQILGDWINARGVRDKIIISTKVGGILSKERILSSADDSLRRLGTDRIEMFCLHHWVNDQPLDEALEALDLLVQQGKVRHLGCSNLLAWQLCKSLWQQDKHGQARMDAAWLDYSAASRDSEKELLPLCHDQQVGVVTYSPLAAGFLTGKYRPDKPVPKATRFDVIPGHQDVYFNESCFRAVERLRTMSEASGHSMVHLALAWITSQPGIASVLVGGRTPAQVDQVFEAQALDLSDAELADLVTTTEWSALRAT